MRGYRSGYTYEDLRHIDRERPGFDRVAFAMRALRVLRPVGLTVLVREGRWELRVETGKAWGHAPGDRWAMVSIPPDATRERIALALAELAGAQHDPFVMAVLLADTDAPS